MLSLEGKHKRAVCLVDGRSVDGGPGALGWREFPSSLLGSTPPAVKHALAHAVLPCDLGDPAPGGHLREDFPLEVLAVAPGVSKRRG
jgi:hypothetical protein